MHTKKHIREELARALRVADVPDSVWNDLLEDQYVEDVLLTGKKAWGELVRVGKRRLKVFQDGVRSTERRLATRPPSAAAGTSASELERAEAVSQYLAQVGDGLPGVRAFRASVLGGRCLSAEGAISLIWSAAAQVLPLQRFQQLGIPLLGHQSQFLGDRESDEDPSLVTTDLLVRWPGAELRESLKWRSGTRAMLVGHPTLRFWPNGEHIVYTVMPGEEYWSYFWYDSVIHEIQRVAIRLTNRITCWGQGEATQFLLTGQAPKVIPIQLEHQVVSSPDHVRGLIRIEVEPWVSAKTVGTAYRKSQRDFVGGQRHNISARNLAAFRYVVEQRRSCGGGSWRKLLSGWNQAYPKWRYNDHRHFRQAYERTERRTIRPVTPIWEAGHTPDHILARETGGTLTTIHKQHWLFDQLLGRGKPQNP